MPQALCLHVSGKAVLHYLSIVTDKVTVEGKVPPPNVMSILLMIIKIHIYARPSLQMKLMESG